MRDNERRERHTTADDAVVVVGLLLIPDVESIFDAS